MLELQSPADQIAVLVSAVTDEQLDAPTPCPGTPVAQLLGHVLGLSIAFRRGPQGRRPDDVHRPGREPH